MGLDDPAAGHESGAKSPGGGFLVVRSEHEQIEDRFTMSDGDTGALSLTSRLPRTSSPRFEVRGWLP